MGATIPSLDIAELRRLIEAATPGPWQWLRHSEEDKPFYSSEWRLAPGILTPDDNSGTPGGDAIDRANAALVIAAVNALPSLIVRLEKAERENEQLSGQLADEHMEHALLKDLLSRPQIDDFWDGLVLEAAHQRQRWGDAHDRDKSAENWFWLVGYLSGKALRSAITGDQEKARHHTISSAAALFQWWKVIESSPNGAGVDADLIALRPSSSEEG